MQDEKQDDENYFTNCTFQKRNFGSNNQGKSINRGYSKQWSKEKKYWVCHKPDCWSTNHSASEIKEFKRRFGNKHPEYKKRGDYKRQLHQYILDFEKKNSNDDFA